MQLHYKKNYTKVILFRLLPDEKIFEKENNLEQIHKLIW